MNHGFDDLFGILCVQTDGNGVDAAELFKQDCFSFHHGHSGFGADIPKTEHSAAVGDNSDGVGLHRIRIGSLRIFCNDFAGFGYTGRVGDGQIFPGMNMGFCSGFNFSVPLCMHL